MNWTFCDGERFSHSQSYPVVDSVYPRLLQRWLGPRRLSDDSELYRCISNPFPPQLSTGRINNKVNPENQVDD